MILTGFGLVLGYPETHSSVTTCYEMMMKRVQLPTTVIYCIEVKTCQKVDINDQKPGGWKKWKSPKILTQELKNSTCTVYSFLFLKKKCNRMQFII